MDYNGNPGDEGEAYANYNGIESTVEIVVDGPLVYYGTQRDINDAMIRAINDHPVLSQVLYAWIADNNTLVVDTLIDGYFTTEDLDISISRPTGNFTAAMIAEATPLGLATGITTATAIGTANTFGAGHGLSLNNEFYSGVDNNYQGVETDADGNGNTVLDEPEDFFNNLNEHGSTSSYETDNVVNAGANNDVIVLALSGV